MKSIHIVSIQFPKAKGTVFSEGMFWQLAIFKVNKIAKIFKGSKELLKNAFMEQFQHSLFQYGN